MQLLIGTSGWHYNHWLQKFYPPDIKGYHELTYHARYFNTVENNSSFYRIASAPTYKTWDRMTPDGYRFSIKLNQNVTHVNRLTLNDETRADMTTILDGTQVLGEKLGAIVVQLPASFRADLVVLAGFLEYFTAEVRRRPYPFDIAIEFRSKSWFTEEVYGLLRRYNVALVTSQSSRYPEVRLRTADFAYIRMHGPEKLFASEYSVDQLAELADYIHSISGQVKRTYVYFNNDFFGYALDNAKELMRLCDERGMPSKLQGELDIAGTSST